MSADIPTTNPLDQYFDSLLATDRPSTDLLTADQSQPEAATLQDDWDQRLASAVAPFQSITMERMIEEASAVRPGYELELTHPVGEGNQAQQCTDLFMLLRTLPDLPMGRLHSAVMCQCRNILHDTVGYG